MLKIVLSHNPQVLRQLGTRAFQRVGTTYKVAPSGAAALDLVRRERPQLAILDVALPDVSGADVCRAVRADPALREVRVMLVLTGPPGAAALDQLAEVGADDLFCLPAPAEELFPHVVGLIRLPSRTSRRVAVDYPVRLRVGNRQFEGHLANLSRRGAQIVLAEGIGQVSALSVRVARNDVEAVTLKARPIWEQPTTDGSGMGLGVEFLEVTEDMRRFLDAVALWDVSVTEDGSLLVTLQGDFDERTEFGELLARLERGGRAEFDMSQVRRLNSWGVRQWLGFLKALPPTLEYSFVRASVPFAMQVGMVSNMLGRGHVESFYAPYHCASCDRSEERLLEAGIVALAPRGKPKAPRLRCPACRGEAAFDELPESYFAFLT